MINVYTKEQIRQIDNLIPERFAIPELLLMENVALHATATIENHFSASQKNIKKIAIFCGSGNNGGDGFAIARQLSYRFDVDVYTMGSFDKSSEAFKINHTIVQKLPYIKVQHLANLEDVANIILDYDCIIDAILGIGYEGKLKDIISLLVCRLNYSSAIKIAIDVPTGMDANTGEWNVEVFKADLTITILGYKLGMINKDSLLYCGQIETAKLGSGGILEHEICTNYILEKADIAQILPKRKSNSNKFDYGKVAVIAGSQNMHGAAALAANAAIKSGAGIVNLFSSKIHPALFPEVICEELSTTADGTLHPENYDYLLARCNKSNSVIIGPGLGKNPDTLELVRKLVFAIDNKSIVIDADAISALNIEDKLTPNFILTPHIDEFARLTSYPREEIIANNSQLAKDVAKKMNCTILLKSVPSIVSDGNKIYWNVAGNPGMATAGSGDVLAGVIGAFVARNIEPVLAAALAALVHGLSGDIYCKMHNPDSLIASDLINSFKYIINV